MTRDFGSGGPFTFDASSRDGIRVYLDGVRKVDLWKNVATTVSKTVNVTIPSGKHSLRVDFVNWTGAANVKFGYNPRTSATVDKVKNSNTESDLAGYRVYRSTSTTVALTPENLLNGDKLSAGGYSGPLPQTGDVCYYVVTAVDTHGHESAASGTAMYYTRDLTGPVDTAALNARGAESEAGVTLTWDASERTSGDFAGYSVFRSRQPRGVAGARREEVGKEVKGTRFTDAAPPPGVTYYYGVVALDHAGNGGVPSAEVVVTVAGNTTAPAAVTGVTAVPKENGVALSLNASEEPGLDHYRVLRGAFLDGKWTYVPVQDPWTLRPREITETAFHDAVPADGQQVRYAVVAVDQYGNQLTPDTGATVTDVTELDLRPTAPPATGAPLANLSTHPPGGLTWALSSATNEHGSAVSGFNIYRWNPRTRTFDLIGTEPEDNSSSGSWFDRTQPTATTVYYRVTVLYADGSESGATETVAVTD